MTTQTAIAPGIMRPLAPGGPTSRSSSSSSSSNTPRILASSTSARPLKPLLASSGGSSASSVSSSSKSRPTIALAPTTSFGKAAIASSSSQVSPQRSSSTSISKPPIKKADLAFNEREGSSGGSTSSGFLESRQVSESPMEEDGKGSDNTVQPKREWILPARAKPGRKPSETEPPTKRKAQNRASQRAFRERKQSYVASLEEKIEEYEKRGVGVSVELQKVARRLKEENEGLRKENNRLKERVQALEGTTGSHGHQRVEKERVTGGLTESHSPSSIGRKRGTDAPMLIMDETVGSGVWNWNTAPSCPRGGAGETEYQNGSKSIASMNRDCGFCTDQSPCLCSGEAVLDLTGDTEPLTASTPTTTTSIKQEDNDGDGGTSSLQSIRRRSSQSSFASTAASEAKRKLWYTVPSMGPPPAPPVQICPTTNDRRARLPFRLGNSSNVLPPLQLTSRGQPKLWPVYSPIQHSFDQNNPSSNQAGIGGGGGGGGGSSGGTVPIYRLRRTRGNSGASPVCSGDPSQCNACSTDPALAAFCKAVSDHLSPNATGPTTPAILDAGNAMPLRNNRKRSYSNTLTSPSSYLANTNGTPLGINLYTNNRSIDSHRPSIRTSASPSSSTSISHQHYRYGGSGGAPQARTLQSIPEAWKRIKQHPSFPKWQGGLDMLADVVSKRSSPALPTSSSDLTSHSNSKLTAAPRVDIESNPSIAMKFHKKSNDRNAEVTSPKSSNHNSTDDNDGENNVKRQRLYVEKESVEDALALLDRGYKTKDQTESAEDNCVCPLNRSM